MNATILLIDDDKDWTALLSRIIAKEGYQVLTAKDATQGLKMLETATVDLIISDVDLPDADGVELVQTIKMAYPLIEIIVNTGYASIADGVRSIQNGAFDYLVKGDDNNKILPLLNKAYDKAQLQKRIAQLEKKVYEQYNFDTIIGHSALIQQAKAQASKVAQTDANVLLLGNTGTGKEVFAQAIHYASKRKHKSFVAVNCSAFGKEILESELFGHKAGAFTGAAKDKRGLLEEANGGTIFLDEIGEMNIDLQAKLLRVVETQQFYKVGDSKVTNIDVRIIAATNRDLQHEADKGNFRSDLFYRLSVFQIALPSLSDRLDDLEILAKHFVKTLANKMNVTQPKMTPAFIHSLRQHPWKGNIRELKNVIERAIILADDELRPEHLPFAQTADVSSASIFDLAEVERLHIQKVLLYTKGNKTETARLLNIGLTTLYRKIQDYNLT